MKYLGADKSLARPGRKQARKHVRDARDLNNIETRAVIRFLFLQGKAPKEIHAILTETLACFLPSRAKDLSAPLYFAEETESLTSNCVSKVIDKLLYQQCCHLLPSAVICCHLLFLFVTLTNYAVLCHRLVTHHQLPSAVNSTCCTLQA